MDAFSCKQVAALSLLFDNFIIRAWVEHTKQTETKDESSQPSIPTRQMQLWRTQRLQGNHHLAVQMGGRIMKPLKMPCRNVPRLMITNPEDIGIYNSH